MGRHVVHTANRIGQVQDFVNNVQSVQSRSFEDDEELFGRDLDAEELFGREYDLEARGPVSLSTLGSVFFIYLQCKPTNLRLIAK